MKKNVFVLIVFALLLGISCQDTVDIEKERKAIMAVLQEEVDATIAMDMERLFAVHVQDSMDTRLQLRENKYTIYAGWKDIKDLFEDWAGYGWEIDDPRNFKENVILKVTGNSAWLMCDNIWKWNYDGESGGSQNIQITFLEKIEGEWKISFNSYVRQPDPEKENEADEEETE